MMRTATARRVYPAKLLLFGEYTILVGGQALAIPLWDFTGTWDQRTDSSLDDSLQQLCTYLMEQDALGQLPGRWLLHRLKADLLDGCYFHSSIPAGYGLGSSGALVAALCESYCMEGRNGVPLSLGQLRKLLAAVEAFFHGTSSGIDPLVSLLGKPLLIDGEQLRQVPMRPLYAQGPIALFLYDTSTSRQTAPLVARFRQKQTTDVAFAQAVEQLKVANDTAIYAFLHGQPDELLDAWKTLSKAQLKWLPDMIPESCVALWQQGIDQALFWLKLCGAGGGGYLLGLTTNWPGTQDMLGSSRLHLIGFVQ